MSKSSRQKPEDDHSTEEFEAFAEIMLGLVQSFNEVMKGGDQKAKLSAIELLSDIKTTMGETLQHIMEKYDLYPEDLEEFMRNDQSEISEKILEVHSQIESVNKQVTPEIEKTLAKAGKTKKKPVHKRKHKMIKHLRTKG